jgi:hypothetical protein
MGVERESMSFEAFVDTPFLSFPHDWGKEPTHVTPDLAIAFL